MDDLTIARMVHAAAVLMWIGGVGFVTLVLIPAIRADATPPQRLARFHRFEARFARQARIWVAVAGASGLWMLWRGQMWHRFAEAGFWWMHAMVALWLVFAAMLFVIEPMVFHRRMSASPTPARDFDRMARGHRVLLACALLTVLGAVGGAHGLF